MMTEDMVVQHIGNLVESTESLRSLAREWRISPAYLSNVVRGKTRPGAKILDALRMERVVGYRFKPVTRSSRPADPPGQGKLFR